MEIFSLKLEFVYFVPEGPGILQLGYSLPGQKKTFLRTTCVFVKTNHTYRRVETQHVNRCYFSFWVRLDGRYLNPKS